MRCAITGIGTANPALYVTQAEALAAYERLFKLTAAERALYRKVLCNGNIRGRFAGMKSTDEAAEDDQDRLIERFRIYGTDIAHAAAKKALKSSGVCARDVGGLVVATCTGYLCPGLTSYLAGSLVLPRDVRPLDIVGMGCGAALPALRAAADMLCASPARPVLCVAVEICTATLFMDPDPGVVVSNAIFGDGAAACVLQASSAGTASRSLLELVDFSGVLLPEYRENLRYRTEKHRLRNVLTRQVPVLGARAVAEAAEALLKKYGLARGDISHWIVHPGGTEVLAQVGKKMKLSREQLRHSYGVFEEFGNMSSPSVLFVLNRLLRDERPPLAGEKGMILSFGAGFTAFAGLVEFGAE